LVLHQQPGADIKADLIVVGDNSNNGEKSVEIASCLAMALW
jgi:hypothetical protein